MENAVERGPDWAGLPVIATLVQPPSSIREAAPEQWLLCRGGSRSRGWPRDCGLTGEAGIRPSR